MRERAGEEAPRNFRVHQRWPVALARASAKPVTSAAVLHLRIPGRFSTDSSLPFLRTTPPNGLFSHVVRSDAFHVDACRRRARHRAVGPRFARSFG